MATTFTETPVSSCDLFILERLRDKFSSSFISIADKLTALVKYIHIINIVFHL